MKKEVLVFIPYTNVTKKLTGGVPKVFLAQLRALSASHKINVTAVFSDRAEVIEAHVKDITGVTSSPVRMEMFTANSDFGGNGLFGTFWMLVRVFWSVVSLRTSHRKVYDLVILNDVISAPYLFSFRSKKKVLYLHAARSFGSRSKRLFLRVVDFFAKPDFFSPTEGIRKMVNEVSSGFCKVIGTPVDKEAHLLDSYNVVRAPSPVVRFVYVGRISPIKNLSEVLKFVDLLQKSGVSARLDVYGSPMNSRESKYLDRLKNEAKLINFVRFLGHIDNVQKAYATADYSLIFSDGEAIPLAGIESFQSRVPVIGYDVEGISDLVSCDGLGYVFPHSDLAEGCRRFLEFEYPNEHDVFVSRLKDFSQESFKANIEEYLYG